MGNRWCQVGVICGLILLVYGQVVGFDFVHYDDPAYVTENAYVASGVSVDGLKWAITYEGDRVLKYGGVENLWHPLTWLSHMVDVEIFGVEDAGGHHVTGLVLYLLGSVLAYLVFAQVMGSGWAALVAALIYALHPLKVESVAWVSERKDVLSGLFFWLSVWCVLRGREVGGRWKLAGFMCFGLALMSKPSVVVLPVLLMLLEGYLDGEKKWGFKFLLDGVKRWWGWFLLGGAVAVVTMMMQGGGSHEFFIEGSLVGRLVLLAPGLLFYLWRVVWPVDLNFHYPRPGLEGELGQVIVVSCWLVVIAILIPVWRARSEMRGLFVGACWFLVCWLPTSGLVYVGTSFTADRYVFLALAGPVAVFAGWLFQKKKGAWVVVVLTMVLAGMSWKQTKHWKDSEALFLHGIMAQPNDLVTWTNYGVLYQMKGNWDEAKRCHETVILKNPKEYIAHYNLGFCHENLDEMTSAERAYVKSLDVYPKYLPSLKNLARIYIESGRLGRAEELLVTACEVTNDRDPLILERTMHVYFSSRKA